MTTPSLTIVEVTLLAHHGEAIVGHQLQGLMLARAPLPGAVFSRVNFQNADFSNADLREAVFDQCDFTGARFTEAQLRAATFHRCRFQQVQAARANMHATKFLDTGLQDSVLTGVDLNLAAFNRCRLSRTLFGHGRPRPGDTKASPTR